MPVSPPSLSPGCSDSYPLSDDSNHLILCRPLLLLPSIFPTRVFSNFTSGSQNIGTSASESVLPMNIQGWFPLGWTNLILLSKDYQESSPTHGSKASVFQCSAFLMIQLSHPYTTTGNTIVLTIRAFVSKVMSLLLNTLSRCVIVFLPRRNCLLISWLQALSNQDLEDFGSCTFVAYAQ